MKYPFEERIAQLETMKREMQDLTLTDFQKTFGEHPGSYPELLKCLKRLADTYQKRLRRCIAQTRWLNGALRKKTTISVRCSPLATSTL
jgi:hypothetical protein